MSDDQTTCPRCGTVSPLWANHLCVPSEQKITRPTDEHVNAVTMAIDPYEYGVSARSAARDILSSTDPAVHAAMLDALVRAGVLVRETIIWTGGELTRYAEPWRQ